MLLFIYTLNYQKLNLIIYIFKYINYYIYIKCKIILSTILNVICNCKFDKMETCKFSGHPICPLIRDRCISSITIWNRERSPRDFAAIAICMIDCPKAPPAFSS